MAVLEEPLSDSNGVISPENGDFQDGGKSNGHTPSSSGNGLSKTDSDTLERTDTYRTIGRLKLRGKVDDLPQNWWFASTTIPLLAATIGPLANVLSIAALVMKWRSALPNNGQLPEGTDDAGVDIPDPEWATIINAFSLGFGFFGNFCLLLNFTKRVRYIIALPATIISWYFATGMLTGILVAMETYQPPVRPGQTYSQGFWYAVEAATLYCIGSMILMINMLGYFLGHYPQHFDLDDDQRTLILQTMMFFFWLAGGAAVFSKVCGFNYADALYFCDVTVLTVGFGDFVSPNDVGRGLVIPYSVIGIIFLGLMVRSIRNFALGMSKARVIKKHQLRKRERTYGRTVTSENELRDRLGLPHKVDPDRHRPPQARKMSTVPASPLRRSSLDQYGRFDVKGRQITFKQNHHIKRNGRGGAARKEVHTHTGSANDTLRSRMRYRAGVRSTETRRTHRREKLLLLKEEKDRFEAMRAIQANTHKFGRYWALSMSTFAFTVLWFLGALIFMLAEHRVHRISYFEALYFSWVSLLTVGYGDFSLRSNSGKAFFVVWSLLAIPTMTILISDMSDTVVSAVNHGTFKLADWTVMPKEGVWHDFLESNPRIKDWIERKTKEHEAKKRLEHGFTVQDPDEENTIAGVDGENRGPSKLEKIAEEAPETTEHEEARRLAQAIKKTANDIRTTPDKIYTYEEWVDFTRLIRFSSQDPADAEEQEEEQGLVEWDWIGEDSPMLADETESEWILDRLCESLNRYTRRQARLGKKAAKRRDVDEQQSALGLDNYSFHPPRAKPKPNPLHVHKERPPHHPSHLGKGKEKEALGHAPEERDTDALDRSDEGWESTGAIAAGEDIDDGDDAVIEKEDR